MGQLLDFKPLPALQPCWRLRCCGQLASLIEQDPMLTHLPTPHSHITSHRDSSMNTTHQLSWLSAGGACACQQQTMCHTSTW
jgi:hypothetical protein